MSTICSKSLGLGYLLASEGEFHEKFNINNCCLQIDDEGMIIEEMIKQMRKVAHAPTKTWKGCHHRELFGYVF